MTLLEQVGLEDRTDFYVDGLSRGMKQRLCLARALIHDPQLLILDEPTSGMDPRSRFEFKEIIRELHEQKKTVLISSHLLSELSEVCTDLGIIDQGHMVLGGSMQDILERVDSSRPLIITVNGGVERTMAILRSHPSVQTISVKGGRGPAFAAASRCRNSGMRIFQGTGRSGNSVYADYRERREGGADP